MTPSRQQRTPGYSPVFEPPVLDPTRDTLLTTDLFHRGVEHRTAPAQARDYQAQDIVQRNSEILRGDYEKALSGPSID